MRFVKALPFFFILFLASAPVFGFRIPFTDIQIFNDAPEFEVVPVDLAKATKNEHRQRVSETEEQLDSRIPEAIQAANSNEYAQRYISRFKGDYFCVRVDDKEYFVFVTNESEVKLVDDAEDCFVVETSEEFLESIWVSYEEGGYVGIWEIKKNVKMSARVYARIILGKIWRI